MRRMATENDRLPVSKNSNRPHKNGGSIMPRQRGLNQTRIEGLKETAQGQRPVVVASALLPTTDVAAFVERANQLDVSGHSDSALDLLYSAIDKMLRCGEFLEVDVILREAQVAALSMNILIGLLTTTLPVRRRLPARPGFFQRVESILRKRGQLKEGLLAGLEG